MPLKNILSRPSTSASNKRVTAIEGTPQNSPKSTRSVRSNKSPERGHKKIGSLQRLSLSFIPSRDDVDGHGSTFHHFLTQEPASISRENSIRISNEFAGTSSSTTAAAAPAEPEIAVKPQPASLPLPLPKTEEKKEEDDEEAEDHAARDEEDTTPRPQRFSLMKFRYASEPQLSSRYRETGEPSNLPPPQIITTAPTHHHSEEHAYKNKEKLVPRSFATFRRKSVVMKQDPPFGITGLAPSPQEQQVSSIPNLTRALSDNSPWQNKHDATDLNSPPAYGDETNSALALPATRLSESSRSEGSSASHKVYAQTTTTHHFIETTTTIFKLKRKAKKQSKNKGPLFPLPEKFPTPSSGRTSLSQTDASGVRRSMSPGRRSNQAVRWQSNLSSRQTPQESPNTSTTALTNAPLGSPGPAVMRRQSMLSNHSGASTPTERLIPPRLGARGRSSTLGSLGKSSERLPDPGSVVPSSRNSTSTAGRRSFGDILTQRLRKDSAPPRHGSGSGSSPGSKANSFQIARDSEPELVYPPREEEDTPASYLEKLEAAVPRGAMATILCKGADDFSKTCLRKYMRGFSYFGESIDISIRKMLMEVILPKETQQIDRLLSGFSDRYHECNPGVFLNPDEANFVAFSILLLQSDNHNKNNKRKMTKQDYVKNTQNGRISVAEDILECFFDNICYTPFIHFDDEIAVENHRLGAPKRKGLIRTKSSEILRGPVDPYTLILDHKLEQLRPSLKHVLETEDPYSTSPINTVENHHAFVHACVLQIISARSRPDAFTTQATISNPAEAQAGLVSIKVAKVGLLWRKSTKKKKAKSPWQEWGAILTDSKLYFFKDVGWAKKLIGQYENSAKITSRTAPLIFKPPLTSFEPDSWMAMDDAVALLDSGYKKHKNAFTFIKHGGFEEVFLANTEADVVDWTSKLNYAATFRTAGVRMRGLLGTNYEGRNMYRKDSEASVQTDDTQQSDQPTPIVGKTNPQLSWEIMFYRRQLVSEKISNFDDHVATAQKELDYLQRNARHLLILLPVQQKSREALVLAAGRMNAKLKWTRKEIWRARTHRDILIKDLEAEATQAFPAPAQSSAQPSRSATLNTPTKTMPVKTPQSGLVRSDTDQTLRSAITAKSPLSIASTGTGPARRPSQAVLEQIVTDASDPPELLTARRKSASSQADATTPPPPRVTPSPNLGADQISVGKLRTPSLHTQPSQHLSLTNESQAATEPDTEEHHVPTTAFNISPNSKSNEESGHLKRHGSEAGTDRFYKHSFQSADGLKDRTGSVRRSLQRTLRETSNPLHMPHHSRSKKGKESGSSLAPTEDGRSMISQESEELKRDPTGRFVLHGKKASVITMGPEWSLSSEDRMKMREQLVAERTATSPLLGQDSDIGTPNRSQRQSLHIDTDMIDVKRRSVDARSVSLGLTSPPSNNGQKEDPASNPVDSPDLKSSEQKSARNIRDSNTFSLYSAVTTTGPGETFHSAKSSPRLSSDAEDSDDSDEDEDENENENENDHIHSHGPETANEIDDDVIVVHDKDGNAVPVKRRTSQEMEDLKRKERTLSTQDDESE